MENFHFHKKIGYTNESFGFKKPHFARKVPKKKFKKNQLENKAFHSLGSFFVFGGFFRLHLIQNSSARLFHSFQMRVYNLHPSLPFQQRQLP